MDIVNYLSQIYGTGTPIFLKDVRIGGKSKTAIKEAFYRAYKRGEIEKTKNGVYFIKKKQEFGGGINFTSIIEKKFIYSDGMYEVEAIRNLFVEGYYSGLIFLNMIGLSQQVPAILEITTNKTSSKKRYYTSGKSIAIIRKARTAVTFQNYKILQFLDMFHFISMDEVMDNKELLKNYVKENGFSKTDFSKYIGLYGTQTIKKIVEGGIIDAFK